MSPLIRADNSPAGVDIRSLIHELRQPLGSIEASTCLLRIVLGEAEDPRVLECLDRIDRQVEAIDRILLATVPRPAQPESRCLTNADSAALT